MPGRSALVALPSFEQVGHRPLPPRKGLETPKTGGLSCYGQAAIRRPARERIATAMVVPTVIARAETAKAPAGEEESTSAPPTLEPMA